MTRSVLGPEMAVLSLVWVTGFVGPLEARGAGAAPEPERHAVSDSIRGRVVDAVTGAPLVGASVRSAASGRETLTDRGGDFVLTGLGAGGVVLEVRRWGYAADTVRVTIPATGGAELEVALSPLALRMEEIVARASPFGDRSYQPARALSREELQRRAGTSVGELLEWEPGVAMRSFGPAPARPVIRGLDGDRILILENGERLGDVSETAFDHAITADPLSVDEVHVVRGPASLLYGSSALGGVVNVLSQDIPRSWARGSSGTMALQAATANGLGAGFGRLLHGGDRWAVTARGSYRDAGDVRTPAGRVSGSQVRGYTGAAGLGHAGEATDAGFMLGVVNQVYGIPEAHDDPFEDVELRTDRVVAQGRIEWRRRGFVEGIELRANAASYTHEEIVLHRTGLGQPEEELELELIQRTAAATLTVRHVGPRPVVRGAVGAHVALRRLDSGGEDALTPHARSGTVALFAYQELEPSPRLRFQAGARVETQRMRGKENERFPGFAAERSATTVSGALGANFRPAPALELGAQLARAHRTPLPEELWSEAAHLGTGRYELGDGGLRNEVGHGLDAFARLRAGRLHVELAAFVNRVDRFVMLQPTGSTDPESGFAIYRYEADAATLEGFEAALEMAPARGWRVTAAADHVRGTRRGDARVPLPFIPPLRGSLGVQREAADWWLGGAVRHAAAQRRVAPDEAATEDYTLLGAEGGVRLGTGGRHVVSLRVDNLLDATYRDHLSRLRDRDLPMPGRNVNLTYRWVF